MICRLCLKVVPDLIKIFDAVGTELSMAAVLSKYFWFEPKDDDPISTAVCGPCWNAVSNFHEFYLNVEEAHRLLTERFSLKKERTYAEKKPKLESAQTPTHSSFTKLNTSPDLKSSDEDDCDSSDLEDEEEFSTYSPVHNDDDEEFLPETSKSPIKENEEKATPRRSTRFKPNDSPNKIRTENVSPNNKVAVDALNDTKTEASSPTPAKNVSTNKTKKRPGEQRGSTAGPNDSVDLKWLKLSNSEVDANIAKYMQIHCEICKTSIPNFSQLRVHMLDEHDCKAYVSCCSKRFFKRALLSDHIMKHLNPDCFRCDDCDKVFADKQCLRNHLLVKHQPDEKKTYPCPNCPKRFAKKYLVEQHRVIHVARTHVCTECQKGFGSACLLKTHIKVVHKNHGTMCHICAKVIRGNAAFARHQLEHSEVAVPKLQCNMCGSWHKDKYTLQKHKRRHNDDGVEHACKICGKISPNRSALLSHHRYVHASKRTYECGVCKKAFKKPLALKEHMAVHTGEVLYKCPHCTKTFNSNANMHSHRKKAHPKEFEETRKKRRENAAKPTLPKNPAKAAIEGTAAKETVIADSTSTTTTSPAATKTRPQYITINTRGEDSENMETHSILVTTADDDGDYNDESDFTGDSIIFTVE